ncbi:MAG: DUF1269 domain-containing protein [Candidatus Nanopelagicales bacterium]
MSDKHQLILIAAYSDLEAAQTDFRDLEGRVKHGVELRSAALVTKGDDGEAQVLEATNRHGRLGAAIGAGLGLLAGLVFQPVLLGLVVGGAGGALVAAVAEHELRSGLKNEVGAALDNGTAVVLALVYPDGEAQIRTTLERAASIRSLELDRSSVKSLDDAVAAEIAKLPHSDT